MMKTNYILYSILLLLICSCTGKYSTATQENLQCFALVNEALNNTQNYRATFDRKVADLKQKLAETQNTEAIYFYQRMLVNDYMEFEADTALSYINKNMLLAQEFRKNDWLVDSYIQLAKTYNSAGMIYQAREALDKALQFPMEGETKLNFWMEEIMFWSLRAINLNLPSPDPKATAFADSIIHSMPDPSSPYYLYAKTWYVTNEADKQALQQELMDYTDSMNPESIWYDKIAECAGVISMVNGDTDNQLKYYALSLVSKITKVSRHIPLLADMGTIAMNKGELTYAARFYNATLRIQADHPEYMYNGRGGLARSVMRFHEIVEDRLEQQNNQNLLLNYLLAFFVILAIALLIATMLELRKVRKLHKELEQSNQELSEREASLRQINEQLIAKEQQLTDTNSDLSEANLVKEEYIGQLFATCSEYIDKIDALKKNINRKLKAGQYAEAIKQTSAISQRDNEYMQDLWTEFDTVFLRLYPDFVEQFNTLLRPDEQIVVKQEGKLNTDLRIYALIRLGIDSSVKISKMLGVSTQTVYNARAKINAKAITSEEDFDLRVRKLKPTISQT